MNRIAYALKVLVSGVPEPEEKEVRVEVPIYIYGDAKEVKLYRADDPRASSRGYYVDGNPIRDWHGKYFHSCADAFKKCPEAEVKEVSIWQIGGKYYNRPALTSIKPEPKSRIRP